MENRKQGFGFLPALLLAAGILAGGWYIGDGIARMRVGPSTVQVKGLAEREVAADVAVWPIRFELTAKNLAELDPALNERTAAITDFLRQAGFPEDSIMASPPLITDLHSMYQGAPTLPPERYKAEATITVRSDQVALVKKTMGKTSELIQKGVALSGERYGEESEFLFTSLNDVKPDLIEEATKNARASALKFAEDSQSELGSIRSAAQGQISIRDRDGSTPEIKIVRVVTTIEYFLK